MGMAASQARYLALVARKSNCEYEGQQINQSRLALSNQSSALFTEMMGLEVPVTPSKSDYTYTTYVFKDGDFEYTIDKWTHLSEAESDGYNYSVTYHYMSNQNVGYQKNKYDPQVQFSITVPPSTTNQKAEVEKIQTALAGINDLLEAATKAKEEYDAANLKVRQLENCNKDITNATAKADDENTYTVTSEADTKEFKQYSTLGEDAKKAIADCLDRLVDTRYGVFTKDDVGENYANIYYNSDDGTIAFKNNLSALTTNKGTLKCYIVSSMQNLVDTADKAYDKYDTATKAYQEALDNVSKENNMPVKIGNTKLTALGTLSTDQAAAIAKIIEQMSEDEIETNLVKCFNTIDKTYNADTYIGGLYTYSQGNSTLYTTYYDLFNSITKGTGLNNIDEQPKLPTYGTQDMDKKITKSSRALVEKDKSGRFTSIRLEDDSSVYDLKASSETDDDAYEDAMNQYAYDKALYDKAVQDINAKTSLIQRQDQKLELRLKQLDTEQNALSTEIDAVAKVVKDNIEKSFKTFSN